MARTPNQFVDPKTANSFSWPINHTEEDPQGKSRQMADGAPTSNIGLVPQQGAATPLILTWKGTIFTDAHFQQMLYWWQLCETQTIYLYDFQGAQYEVIITDFEPQRVSVAGNPKVPNQYFIWKYTIVMRVLTVLAGDWAGVTP